MNKKYPDASPYPLHAVCVCVAPITAQIDPGTASSGEYLTLSPEGTLLNENEQANLDRFGLHTNIADLRLITLGDLPTIQQEGKLEIELPHVGCKATFSARHVETLTSDSDYFWYGEIREADVIDTDDCECAEGSIGITLYEDMVAAHGSVDGEEFEMYSLSSENAAFLTREIPDSMSCDTGGSTEGNVSYDDEMAAERSFGSFCKVRVLFLVSPSSDSLYPNIETSIYQAFSEAQQVFRNSEIPENRVALQYAGVAEWDFTTSGNLLNDLKTITVDTTQAGGPDQQVWDLREEHDADIVVGLVDSPTYSGNAGYSGNVVPRSFQPSGALGTLDTFVIDSSLGFVILRGEYLNNSYAFTHEIGHQFNCGHEGAGGTLPLWEAHEFKYGRCFKKRERRTVGDAPLGGQVPYFSNPDLSYRGEPLGVHNDKENYRAILTNGCMVANYMEDDDQPQMLLVSIDTGGEVCECAVETVAAEVTGNTPGPYVYEWFTSTDGFNFTPDGNDYYTYPVRAPCNSTSDGVFVRLVVTAPDGASDQSTFFVALSDSGPHGEPCARAASEQPQKFSSFSLTNNPTDGKLYLQSQASRNNSLPDRIRIFSSRGGDILSFSTAILSHSKHLVEVDVSSLAPGIYFLYDGVSTQKFVKL